jgi:hypothetical protein
VREAEQVQNTAGRRAKRSNSVVREAEQVQNTEARRAKRSNSAVRKDEQKCNTAARRTKRSIPVVREEEQAQNTAARRVKRNEPRLWDDVVANFNRAVKEGPTHICRSCDRLFFKESMKSVTRKSLISKGCSEEFLQKVILSRYLNDVSYEFCSTCASCICGKNKKYPRFNINMSQLGFPEIPDVVRNLTSLEEVSCTEDSIHEDFWLGM